MLSMSGMRLDPATPPPATNPVTPPATPHPASPPPAASTATPTPPATFTRDELDAAEPERHPSPGRRWLLGLGIGALAFGLLSFEGLPLLTLLCLPFALTPAGAGALVGSGAAWFVSLGWTLVLWLNGDFAESPTAVTWMVTGLVALVVGVVGTIVVARRSGGPDGA